MGEIKDEADGELMIKAANGVLETQLPALDRVVYIKIVEKKLDRIKERLIKSANAEFKAMVHIEKRDFYVVCGGQASLVEMVGKSTWKYSAELTERIEELKDSMEAEQKQGIAKKIAAKLNPETNQLFMVNLR
jgi:uncharacterized protein YwgA